MQLECHSEYKPLKIFISRKCLKSLRRPGVFLSIWGVEALNAVNTADSQVQVPFPKRHQNGVVRHDYFGVVLCLDKTLSWVREWQKDRGDARPMLGGMGSPRKVGARYAAHASISISQSHLGGEGTCHFKNCQALVRVRNMKSCCLHGPYGYQVPHRNKRFRHRRGALGPHVSPPHLISNLPTKKFRFKEKLKKAWFHHFYGFALEQTRHLRWQPHWSFCMTAPYRNNNEISTSRLNLFSKYQTW